MKEPKGRTSGMKDKQPDLHDLHHEPVQFWAGEVHSLQVFNRALTPEEVLEHALGFFAQAEKDRATEAQHSAYEEALFR